MALAGHVSKKMLERYSHIGNNAKRQAIAAAFNTAPKKAARPSTVKELPQFSHLQGHSAIGRIM
jgi:hypothetical protein